MFDKDHNFQFTWGEAGAEPGQFANLHGLIVDDEGYLYVADTGNNRVQKFHIEY